MLDDRQNIERGTCALALWLLEEPELWGDDVMKLHHIIDSISGRREPSIVLEDDSAGSTMALLARKHQRRDGPMWRPPLRRLMSFADFVLGLMELVSDRGDVPDDVSGYAARLRSVVDAAWSAGKLSGAL